MMRLARLPYSVARRSSQKLIMGPALPPQVAAPTASAAVVVEHRRHRHQIAETMKQLLKNDRMFDKIYQKHDAFAQRHLGPRKGDAEEMLSVIGADVSRFYLFYHCSQFHLCLCHFICVLCSFITRHAYSLQLLSKIYRFKGSKCDFICMSQIHALQRLRFALLTLGKDFVFCAKF